MPSTAIRVPLAQIRPDHGRWPVRRLIGPQGVVQLANDLKFRGLQSPLTVVATTDGGYDLVLGRRRLAAAESLQWREIAVVVQDMSAAEAATMVLRSELSVQEAMTCLERAWAVVDTIALRDEERLPSGVRATAEACGLTKSTVHNAFTVGRVFPPALVYDLCIELGVSLDEALSIEQAPLLLIAREEVGREGLLRAALMAHVRGDSATWAVRDALGIRPKTGLRERTDGRLSLRMNAPMQDLAPEAARALARQLRAGADRLEAVARECPIGVHSVQPLDGSEERTLRLLRCVRTWLATALGYLRSWVQPPN